MKEKSKKQLRELSDEELEKVTGGEDCWGDDVELCITIIHGVWNRKDCTCNGEPIGII